MAILTSLQANVLHSNDDFMIALFVDGQMVVGTEQQISFQSTPNNVLTVPTFDRDQRRTTYLRDQMEGQRWHSQSRGHHARHELCGGGLMPLCSAYTPPGSIFNQLGTIHSQLASNQFYKLIMEHLLSSVVASNSPFTNDYRYLSIFLHGESSNQLSGHHPHGSKTAWSISCQEQS